MNSILTRPLPKMLKSISDNRFLTWLNSVIADWELETRKLWLDENGVLAISLRETNELYFDIEDFKLNHLNELFRISHLDNFPCIVLNIKLSSKGSAIEIDVSEVMTEQRSSYSLIWKTPKLVVRVINQKGVKQRIVQDE